MSKILLIFFFILFALPVTALDSKSEKIISFHSYIKIHQDSSMTVTEAIKVNVTGRDIKHGIYRDFPTRYKDKLGNNYVVDFNVIEVLRDGISESYHFQNLSNGQRIYIGSKDIFVPTGEHTYTLVYETKRQLGFFEDFDELYWNVTGNGWSFVIDEASLTVELPEGAQGKVISFDGYTGYSGDKGKNFSASCDVFGNITFSTTRPLLPGEGLTIVVSWPKGYVQEPSIQMKLGYFIRDNRSILVGFLGLLFLLAYYLIVWNFFGRDPAKGTIIPLYNPPQDFSPALVRYIAKMGYDNKVFTSAILNMAVKGYLKIEETSSNLVGFLAGKTYVIKKTGKDESLLAAEEETAARSLLGLDNDIELKKENYLIISAAINNLHRVLAKKAERVYFFTNSVFFGFGFFITVCFITIVFISLVQSGGLVLLGIGANILMILLNVIFYHLLKAPTLRGRGIMDQIEGFRMFLAVTEKERLNLLNPPERTPGLFERYLPYALALDVEQKWAEQFTEVFERIRQQGTDYHPAWYTGHSWSNLDSRGFAHSLGTAFSGAIASSAVPPGSSSGGGGGGSSGGGGGGGGGGGW